jgi:hypothetical protein
MKSTEIKNLIIGSADPGQDTMETVRKLEEAGVTYGFSKGFTKKVSDKIFSAALAVNREIDFVRSMNIVFSRIALTGIAAIVILLISIFLSEGSLSMNSILGLGDIHDESIICLLTGN